MKLQPKMQHCWFCGKELGIYIQLSSDRDTCGSQECNREAINDERAEREEAHEQLNRDRGWA